MPGTDKNQTLRIAHSKQAQMPQYHCIHFLLTVDSSHEKVFAIAKRVGWHAVRKYSLGVIDMIEFWIENKMMVEIVLASEEKKAINALKSKDYTGS